MENLRQWCSGVCCCVLFCCIVLMAAPKGAEKLIRLCTILLFCLCLIGPFLQMDLSFAPSSVLNAEPSEYTFSGLEGSLAFLITQTLTEHGVEPYTVDVIADETQTRAKVVVYRDQSTAFVLIRRLIREEYGMETDLVTIPR